MGTCQFCGQQTQNHCIVCMVFGCSEHLTMHYFSQTHRVKAASLSIPLDRKGAPVVEQRDLGE